MYIFVFTCYGQVHFNKQQTKGASMKTTTHNNPPPLPHCFVRSLTGDVNHRSNMIRLHSADCATLDQHHERIADALALLPCSASDLLSLAKQLARVDCSGVITLAMAFDAPFVVIQRYRHSLMINP